MLKIDNDLSDLCPPLSPAESALLEESLVREGCRDPIVVWNSTIVDGHNRYRICSRLGIKFQIKEETFPDKATAKLWILKNQLARRNLGFLQAAYLRGTYYRRLRDANKRENGYTQEHVAKLFGVSSPTIRSDRELADAIDTLSPKAREHVLSHGVLASRQQVIDLSQLSHKSQDFIIDKIEDRYLTGISQAILKLRPGSRPGVVDGERRKRRCPGCGCRLAEGVFTCLACDIKDADVERLIVATDSVPINEAEFSSRIEMAREFKRQGDQVEYAANLLIDWLRENTIERNTDYHKSLSRLLKLLAEKVGQRRESDKVLRVLIDVEGGDRARYDALTPREKQVFDFVRKFSMAEGRPPKLIEIAKRNNFGKPGDEQSQRSAAEQVLARLRKKGVLVRD